MTLLGIHVAVFAAVNLLLVVLWLLLGGSPEALVRPLTGAREHGLWPSWVAALWLPWLLLHAGLTVVLGRRRRRRRRRARGPAAPQAGPSWITAMFTDIAGSTRLADELGDGAYSEMLADHRRTVRSLVRRHRGEEVGTQGDGFLLRFPSPQAAVRCAVELQRTLAEQRRDGVGIPPVRVGAHAGEVIAAGDGDVIGRMVNIASRVASEAGPHEILVTEPVADHAGPGIVTDDRGLCELRGIEAPRHLLAVRWDDDAGDQP
jgi:class 3 adenylate cyclase